MSVSLSVAAHHPAVPGLIPGDHVFLADGCLTIAQTPPILRRIAAALRDGALVFGPEGPPTWDEIEAAVEAEWDRLTARIDASLADIRARRACA